MDGHGRPSTRVHIMTAFRIAQIAKPNGPISRSKIFADIAAGKLAARKIGAATVILETDWRRYLEGVPRVATPNDLIR